MAPSDARQFAPATERNRQPILSAFQKVLPSSGNVLEVASGTGEHAVYFAAALPNFTWLPTDPDPVAIASIRAWQTHTGVGNLLAPIQLDVTDPGWPQTATAALPQTAPPQTAPSQTVPPQTAPQAIVAINMIHIAPWAATLGLLAGAHQLLPPGGLLYLYGPYQQQGQHTAPSNAAFDEMLRSRNPAWGVRDLGTVIAEAERQHLFCQQVIEMPANNLSVILTAS